MQKEYNSKMKSKLGIKYIIPNCIASNNDKLDQAYGICIIPLKSTKSFGPPYFPQ